MAERLARRQTRRVLALFGVLAVLLALGGTFADIPPSVEIQGKPKVGSCLFFFAGLLRVTSPLFARPGLNPDRFP